MRRAAPLLLLAAGALLAAEPALPPLATGYTRRLDGNLLAKLNTSFEAGLRNASAAVYRQGAGGRVVEGDGAHGSRCLELAAGQTFLSEMLPLAPGDYTVSFACRAAGGALPFTVSVMTSYQQPGFSHTANRPAYGRIEIGAPEAGWTRHRCRVVVPPDGPGQVAVRIAVDGGGTGGGNEADDGRRLRIDALDLRRGDGEAPYQPAGPVELALSCATPAAMTEADAPLPLAITIANVSGGALHLAPELVLHDLMGGRRILPVPAIDLPADGRHRQELTVAIPAGQQLAILRVPCGDEVVTANLVLSARAPHPGFRPDPQGPFLGRIVLNRPDGLAIAEDLGLASIRLYGTEYGLRWEQVEPQPGGFDFALADRLLAPVPPGTMLLGLLDYHSRKGPPAWVETVIPPPGAWRISKPLAKDAVLWSRYVTTAVGRYRGRITAWEVHNEPNGIMAPEAYVSQLAIAYRAVKAVDPACAVVAFCSTLDNDRAGKGDMLGFIRTCLELGAGDWCDVISFHPYVWPHSPEQGRLREAVAELTALRDRLAPGKPLWNTEFGWTSGVLRADRPRTEQGENQNYDCGDVHPLATAAWCVRAHLMQFAGGVAKVHFFNLPNPWSMEPFRAAGLYLFDYDGTPLPVYLAYRELIHRLGGFRFVRERLDATDGTCLQLYRRQDPAADLVVAWCAEGHRHAAAWRPTGAGAAVHDLFGRPLPVDGGALAISDLPLYVTPAAGGGDETLDALWTAAGKTLP